MVSIVHTIWFIILVSFHPFTSSFYLTFPITSNLSFQIENQMPVMLVFSVPTKNTVVFPMAWTVAFELLIMRLTPILVRIIHSNMMIPGCQNLKDSINTKVNVTSSIRPRSRLEVTVEPC